MRLITLVSTIGGLCFGYDTGDISGALIFMKYDLNLSSAQEGFFGFFAATNVIILVLLVKYLPETRGMTLKQIEKKFRF